MLVKKGTKVNTMKLPHTTQFQKTIILLVSECSPSLWILLGANKTHLVAGLIMAEEVKQPSFPDMSNGIDYTKYTVEGSFLCLWSDF